jgi:predicted metal-dependent peptidase
MAQTQTATDPKYKLSKAKARLLMDHPFFATLLLRTEVLVTDAVPTAATDGERMYFNPAFLDQLTIDEAMFVLCHEVGHDSLLHSLRMGMRNPETWNHACDHAINLMLLNQGMKMPAKVPGLADARFKGWSADRIYDDLRRNPPPPSPGAGGGKPDPNGKGGNKPGGPQPGNTLAGDVLPSKTGGDPAKQAAAETRAKQKVAAAANMARMAGKLHGDLERMVGECLETKVAWTDVLREYMLKIVKSRESWARRNRRFKDFYLPTRHSRQLGPIIFIPDTSGSMWGDDMEKICSEIAHCTSQCVPENIRVVWADSRVQGEQVFDPNEFEFSKLVPVGGGGTDMRAPLTHVEQYDPQVVILMTDCETPWPNAEPPYPVIVISTTDKVAPIGTTINI